MSPDLYLEECRELEEDLTLVFLYILPRSCSGVQLPSDSYWHTFSQVQSSSQMLGIVTLTGEEEGDKREQRREKGGE